MRINDDGTVVAPVRIKVTDPATSLYSVFGEYSHNNKISLGRVEQVMLTGVSAVYIGSPVYGLSTTKTEEFICNGLGAQFETELDDMVVISMSTGTSLIQCLNDDTRHTRGTGLGGGTFVGPLYIMLKADGIKQISMPATQGEGSNIDVRIGDISPNPLPNLPKATTASLFGDAKSNALHKDIALGIITMVLQTIGSSTTLAPLGAGIRDYVLVGNLILPSQRESIFGGMEKLYGVNFIIPKYNGSCTAVGAALCSIDEKRK